MKSECGCDREHTVRCSHFDGRMVRIWRQGFSVLEAFNADGQWIGDSPTTNATPEMYEAFERKYLFEEAL